MSDYNRELHHDEHHDTITDFQFRLSAAQNEAAERGRIISEQRVRIKELEAEHQLRYGFESRLSAAEENLKYKDAIIGELDVRIEQLKRAEVVVEALKRCRIKADGRISEGEQELDEAIRQYEEGKNPEKPPMGLAKFFHGHKRDFEEGHEVS